MTETNWGRHGTGMTPAEFRAWVDAGKPDLGGFWLADAATSALREAQSQAWDEGWVAMYASAKKSGVDGFSGRTPNPYRSES